jgi:hypothetical protein
MSKRIAAAFLMLAWPWPAQQPKPAQPLIDTLRQYLRRVGATVDEARSKADVLVSKYAYPKGDSTTIVLVNDRRKNLLGFYIYDFGNLKGASNAEAIYKYLLEANDQIAIGAFFVDGEQDIGYKYLMSVRGQLELADFQSIYLIMAAVARERRPEIRRLLSQ